MPYLLTTDPGIEEIVAEEFREAFPGEARTRPYGCQGHVRVETEDVDALRQLTTIHHVIEIRREDAARTLEEIERSVSDVDLPELRGAASFRVTSKRDGTHDFGSMEIQRVAGAVLFRRYGTSVDLEDFELNVRVDLYDHHLVVGIQRTKDSLGNRIRRSRALRSSIKPTMAAAMLRLAGAHRGGGELIDPMCGTGTIPIEARRINPDLHVLASDWDEETIDVARETIANHGLEIEVMPGDARSLGDVYPDRFDFIVTDPPYGVRQARRSDLGRLYGTLLPSFEKALKPSGRIVLVVLKYRAFLSALERTGLCVVDQRSVELGGLYPRIFVLRRR